MTTEHYEFLKANAINFETVKLGFVKNLPMPVLTQYEAIYRAYLDEKYVVTPWCSACVFDMLKRLTALYEEYQANKAVPIASETTTTTQPKRKRKS